VLELKFEFINLTAPLHHVKQWQWWDLLFCWSWRHFVA